MRYYVPIASSLYITPRNCRFSLNAATCDVVRILVCESLSFGATLRFSGFRKTGEPSVELVI
jgi:hypothetical protein